MIFGYSSLFIKLLAKGIICFAITLDNELTIMNQFNRFRISVGFIHAGRRFFYFNYQRHICKHSRQGVNAFYFFQNRLIAGHALDLIPLLCHDNSRSGMAIGQGVCACKSGISVKN